MTQSSGTRTARWTAPVMSTLIAIARHESPCRPTTYRGGGDLAGRRWRSSFSVRCRLVDRAWAWLLGVAGIWSYRRTRSGAMNGASRQPWRRSVSETTLGRALEFMRKPQDVEVQRGADWILGSMIGWRQEDGSSCRVMVRVTERGVERTAWADLHDVRLPEQHGFPQYAIAPAPPTAPERTDGPDDAVGDEGRKGRSRGPRDLRSAGHSTRTACRRCDRSRVSWLRTDGRPAPGGRRDRQRGGTRLPDATRGRDCPAVVVALLRGVCDASG